MNYKKHYDLLIERAKNRELESYTENHHIVPRCLGGTNKKDNLVRLTPEEHYVAHQLLIKIYPKHEGLVWAAIQMTSTKKEFDYRINNKLYGWLKRKQSKAAKQRLGKKNGSHGRYWYYNPETLENIKCFPEEVPENFIKGRKLKPESQNNNKCLICGNITKNKISMYCSEHSYKSLPELATQRFEDFLISDCKSIREYAKKIGVSQPLLSSTWKKYVKNYTKITKEGSYFKKNYATASCTEQRSADNRRPRNT